MNVLANFVRITFLALLFVTPWLFGGVWARVQWILMLVTAMLLAIDLVTRFGEDDRPNLVPTAWLPVLAGIVLGLFQLIPWPPALAASMAPSSVQWRNELTESALVSTTNESKSTNGNANLSGQSPVSSGKPTRYTRSMYVVATREYLALLTLALAVFVLASIYFVDRQTVVWFLATFACCGGVMSFFGLVQRLSWNGKFYWVFEPLVGSIQSFGPFVNRNNAGGYLNLCLAAGLGLLVWVHQKPERDGRRRRSSRRSRRDRGHRSAQSYRPHSSRPKRQAPEAKAPPGEFPAAPEAPPQTTPESPPSEASAGATDSKGTSDVGPPPPGSVESSGGESASSELTPESAFRRGRPTERSSKRDRHRGDEPDSSYGSAASYPPSFASSSRLLSGTGKGSLRESISDYVADLNARKLGALALVAVTAGGVFCTASRGSILALFTAAMVTSAVLAARRGNRGYAVALLVVLIAGVSLTSWGGQTEFVRARFELMLDDAQLQTGRLPNWKEALRVVPHFAFLGSGLGTYAFVYERYQQRFLGEIIHRHAENQFVQALVDGGIVALVLLIVTIFLTTVAMIRLYRSGGLVNNALAITGTFALISQIVGGMFDFGMYIPSNMMLMAATCGMIVGRAALLTAWPSLDKIDQPQETSGYRAPSPTRPETAVAVHRHVSDERQTVAGETRSRRAYAKRRHSNEPARSLLIGLPVPSTFVTILVGFLMIGSLFGSLEMNRAARIESAVRRANLRRLIESNTPEEMAKVSSPLMSALPQRWDDALAHQHLAQLYLTRYQSETYHRLLAQREAERAADSETHAEPAMETAAPAETDELDDDLWIRASVQNLHQTLERLEQSGDSATATQIINSDSVQQLLVPAVRHFLAARQFAPTIPRVHYRLAELVPVDRSLGDERVHLKRAQLLSPGNATIWYWSGVLALNSGRLDEACEDFRRSLELSRLHVDEIMLASKGKLTLRQLLDQALPDQADLLLRVAIRHFAGDDLTRYRNVFLTRAEAATQAMDLSPAQVAYTQAEILKHLNRKEEAVPFYEDAVSRDSNNLRWRYNYAQMLIELKDYDKADRHVTYLIRARPNYRPYDRLWKRFNRLRLRAGIPDVP